MGEYELQHGRPSWMTEVLETQDAVSSELHQIKFFFAKISAYDPKRSYCLFKKTQMNYITALIILASVTILGCSHGLLKDDKDIDKVTATDGVLVTKFDSNIDSGTELLAGHGSGLVCLLPRAGGKKICFIDSSFYSKEKISVLTAKPGQYYWYHIDPPSFIFRLKRPRLRKQPYVEIKRGVITYIGNLEIDYDRVNIANPVKSIKVTDKEAEVVKLLNEEFTNLMTLMSFEKVITDVNLR